MYAAIRSKDEIVLNVASSGITSLLLPGGRTAHSRFKIPLKLTEDMSCNIDKGSPLAELIVRSRLIIWDETPMVHRHCIEALNKTLQDIMSYVNPLSSEMPFGGKTVVMGGDFRQILPVIPKGTRQDIVHATVNASDIWRHCTVLRLTKNMRLQNLGSDAESSELKLFADWITSISDRTLGGPNDDITEITIPVDILLHYDRDPLDSIFRSTYPSFGTTIVDSSYLEECAILAPTNEIVESINEHTTKLTTGECVTYQSSDSPCKSDSGYGLLNVVHMPEFVNGIKTFSLPNHEIKLKVDTLIMLIRNIDDSLGLCKGTRLVVTILGDHVIQAKVLSGSNA